MGMAKTAIYGPQSVTYEYEKEDTCLDLSINAMTRQALSIKLKDNFSLDDYKGFTVSCWVKKHPGDPEPYTILSQTQKDSIVMSGWQIKTQTNGAWEWWFSDGFKTWNYRPTIKQKIDDGEWHLLTFSFDRDLKQARLYYDGNNVAIYSLNDSQIRLNSSLIHIGTATPDEEKPDLFNGQLDDLQIWSRVINDDEVRILYKKKEYQCFQKRINAKSIKVMTWNLWDGGTHDGKYVGVQRIIRLVENEMPDILLLQEAGEAGIAIADALNYKLYKRSDNLCVLSQYPIVDAHNIFKSDIIGCVQLQVKKDQSIFICPVQLSETPLLEEYLKSTEVNVDSVLVWEMESRGKEVQFLLSELSHLTYNADMKPLIIGGDFNTGSHLDWTTNNTKKNFGLSIPYPTSMQMEAKGFIDSYRQVYPDETIDFGYTLSPRTDSIMKNRTSFIYYKGKHLATVESYTLNDYAFDFPSDHAAVITTFEWQD